MNEQHQKLLAEFEQAQQAAKDFARELRKIADGAVPPQRLAGAVLNRHPEWDRAWR